jgi:DNA repair photolyase
MDASDHNVYLKGRGAQTQPNNSFSATSYVSEHIEGLDIPFLENSKTTFIPTYPQKVLSYNKSPDLPFQISINPYQGCEHGCVYCYARNSHEYWGFGPGLDFERKILVKQHIVEVLEQQLNHPRYVPQTIMLSGNTDCYQPVERTYQLTRKILQTLLDYRHPVAIITKNSLILRDLDLLKELASLGLTRVAVSLHTLDEELRQRIEPRTASTASRLRVMEQLSQAGIPVHLMVAPLIPGLNSDGIPALLKAAAAGGARTASYGLVRLNGAVDEIFKDWLYKQYPDRAEKVLHHIEASHGGQRQDSRWGVRMRGEGNLIESIARLFELTSKKYFTETASLSLCTDLFRPKVGKQLGLFDQ